MRHELQPHAFDWSKVFEPNSDLNRFRLALHAGNSVAEARAIAAAKAPQDYDAARVWGGGSER